MSERIALFEALTALLLFMALNSVTGARLLLLARRTRELPELYLGVGHLLGGALGWALVMLGGVFGSTQTQTLPLVLMLAGLGCLNVAHAAMALFAWRVFAPRARWQALPFAILAATLAIDFVHNGILIRLFAPPPEHFWFWPGALARSGCWLWITVVAYVHARKLQRRLPLGLADAQATNRMFLLFLAGAFVLLLAVVVNAASLMHIWERHPLLMGSLSSLLGMPSAICSWLAFVPPRRYTEWVQRRAPAVLE